ncbi:MAG: chromate resistance protein [Dehalococcoidia bacterium]
MKWVTTDHVYLDRVACGWLIRRKIDPAAEFKLCAARRHGHGAGRRGRPMRSPAELGPHDAAGTTFEKMLRKYSTRRPSATSARRHHRRGVHHALHRGRPDEFDVGRLEGIGLDALSEGMIRAETRTTSTPACSCTMPSMPIAAPR